MQDCAMSSLFGTLAIWRSEHLLFSTAVSPADVTRESNVVWLNAARSTEIGLVEPA
jgi:hypothetical protein